MQTINPGRATAAPRGPRAPEVLDRNRLAWLLEHRYNELRTAGVVCFGIRDVNARVPPLWSAAREPAAPAEAPAPVA